MLFSLALSFASMAIAAPRCESLFLPDQSVFPAIEYVADPVRAYESYTVARQHFESKFGDGAEIEKRVSELAAGRKPLDPQGLLLRLKEIRKTAIIVRSEFILFDRDHEEPAAFEAFTKTLGKLNDVLEFQQWALVPDAAEAVLNVLKPKKISKDLRSFDPATSGSIRHELEELHGEIATLLRKPELSVKEFHEVRKLLKHFLAMMQIDAGLGGANQAQMKQGHEFLFALNEDLGAVRDGALADGLKQIAEGRVLDETKERQPLSAEQKEKIELFLAHFEAVKPAKPSRVELALQNHLRFDREAQAWQVLVPVKKGYEVKSFDEFADAAREARRIETPLDLDSIRQEAVGLLARVKREMEKTVGDDGQVIARVKEADSFKEKLFEKVLGKEKKVDWRDLTDIVGTRVIVENARRERKIAARLHDEFKNVLVEEHERDYEEGYHAHHLVGESASGLQFEMQVMTRRMNQWSQWQHDRLYKPKAERTAEEMKNLRNYGVALAQTIRVLDDGGQAGWPRAQDYHVRDADAFVVAP